MPLALYCRVSSEEQKKNQTIQTQTEFLERFCELHSIPIAERYLDDGQSGTIPLELRPEGARLLQDAKARRFDAVLIYKLDRLGRDPRLILNAVNELEGLGLRIQSATEPFDTATPAGRFLLTILSGVAGLERDTLIERSTEGSNRLARAGAWLGGIVPYGYRVTGRKREARLEVSEDPLLGLDLSEADVIRLIYRLTVDEHRSCLEIAGHLNALGIPPSYAKDGRAVLRGKRQEATAAIWRPGRIRNMLINPTYRGIHRYGQRSARAREIIEREVPAIVDDVTWQRAQEVLREHFLFNRRNARRQYLLRGLIKCGLCGLTYIGCAYPVYKSDRLKSYYTCNGKHGHRGIYGLQGKPCPSKAVNAELLEGQVWRDILGFLNEPGPILDKLLRERQGDTDRTSALVAETDALERSVTRKLSERDLILDLYRRGRIDGADLDRQLDKIASEERELKARLVALRAQVQQVENAERQIASVAELLAQLRERLSNEPTWEERRAVIEALVSSIRVDTVEESGKRRAIATVGYRFT